MWGARGHQALRTSHCALGVNNSLVRLNPLKVGGHFFYQYMPSTQTRCERREYGGTVNYAIYPGDIV